MDCACDGVNDKMWVFVTDETKKYDITKYVTEKISFNHVAFEACAIDAIPKNESGKTLYVELDKYNK